MRAINITPNAVPRGAADQHIRKIMLAAGEPRETDGTGNPVSADLDPAMTVVFVSDHRGQRPCLDTVAGRKRGSTVKELAAISPGQRAAPLRDLFQRRHDDCAINQRFRAEQAGLARAFVVPGASEKIESRGDAAGSVS